MPKQAFFRFYAELNDFLAPERRFATFARDFELNPSVKDMIESLGVPHTEVDMIVVDGDPVPFGYRVRDRDRISVYPMFESIDVSRSGGVHPRPLRVTRFLLDGHLGRLARYLRLLGFDSLYGDDRSDSELAAAAEAEARLLLTRDIGLLRRGTVSRGYFVRAVEPRRQLEEVVARFDLFRDAAPFTRCMVCNGVLRPVAKQDVAHRVPERARRGHNEFRVCPTCARVYWEGSHHARMKELVDDVTRKASRARGP